MTNKSKAIGTKAESAVASYLRGHGYPGAERRALRGADDAGDIAGTPICWEIKAGEAAKHASAQKVEEWWHDTERETAAAGAALGVLVMQRAGYGPGRCGMWWAVLSLDSLPQVLPTMRTSGIRVMLTLADLVACLKDGGYGESLS